MLSHSGVWAAIDALAERHGLSVSGLARRAGLDSTAFNRSKRLSGDGRPRWPSTESIAKILAATGTSLGEFMKLLDAGPAGGYGAPAQRLLSVMLRPRHRLGGEATAAAGGRCDRRRSSRVGEACWPRWTRRW